MEHYTPILTQSEFDETLSGSRRKAAYLLLLERDEIMRSCQAQMKLEGFGFFSFGRSRRRNEILCEMFSRFNRSVDVGDTFQMVPSSADIDLIEVAKRERRENEARARQDARRVAENQAANQRFVDPADGRIYTKAEADLIVLMDKYKAHRLQPSPT